MSGAFLLMWEMFAECGDSWCH